MKQYVDMRGVIEVRTQYDNEEDGIDPETGQMRLEDMPVDMYAFQEDMEWLPDNFCAKDK